MMNRNADRPALGSEARRDVNFEKNKASAPLPMHWYDLALINWEVL